MTGKEAIAMLKRIQEPEAWEPQINEAAFEAPEMAIEALEAQPEPQTARVFQEIVVEYPSISTYPEHEGKPYFSIKYTENGQGFIGYGTYKPEVLSEYLKEYFMPSAQNVPNNDLISRKAAIDVAIKADIENHSGVLSEKRARIIDKRISALPSAEPKRGKWEIINLGAVGAFDSCSECKRVVKHNAPFYNYCPNCGADMR